MQEEWEGKTLQSSHLYNTGHIAFVTIYQVKEYFQKSVKIGLKDKFILVQKFEVTDTKSSTSP